MIGLYLFDWGLNVWLSRPWWRKLSRVYPLNSEGTILYVDFICHAQLSCLLPIDSPPEYGDGSRSYDGQRRAGY